MCVVGPILQIVKSCEKMMWHAIVRGCKTLILTRFEHFFFNAKFLLCIINSKRKKKKMEVNEILYDLSKLTFPE